MSHHSVIRFISSSIDECSVDNGDRYNISDPAGISAELCEEAIRSGSQVIWYSVHFLRDQDNMTSMLVFFTNGSNYHQTIDEYLPGPYEDSAGHGQFQEVF